MKLLLLSLGLTLVCANHGGKHEVLTSNIEVSKLSGEWYTILVAADVREKVEENGSMRMFLEYIEALDNSSVVFKYHQNVNGECIELPFVFEETEQNNIYRVTYDGYNRIQITEADYNDYFILNVFNINSEKVTQVLELNARNPEISPTLKRRFEKICENIGIPKENVMDLTNADRCFQARGSPGDQDSRCVLSDGVGVAQRSLSSKTSRA